MGSETHLSTLLMSQAGRRPQPWQWLLLACQRIADLLPQKLYRRGTQVAIDSCVAASAVLLAYQFRFDLSVPANYARGMWFWILVLGIIRPLSLIVCGAYRNVWRFLHLHDLTHLILAGLPPSLVLLSLRLIAHSAFWATDVPFGVIVLEFGTFVGLASGIRGLRRLLYEETKHFPAKRKRALLLGTEETLPAALWQVRSASELNIVGLITPGAHFRGRRIRRVPVIAEPSELSTVLANSSVNAIVIADVSPEWTQTARSTAANLGIDVHVLPSAANVMRGHVRVITPVEADRAFESKRTDDPPDTCVFETYRDRVVLVTGAGGSIGFELCRQVSRLGIRRLILFDRDENAVFEADRELRDADTEIIPVVGDIRDNQLLRHIFQQHRPEIVLHAAAFKHVPIMETNTSEAVLNNVAGTRLVADFAHEFASERFVLISSDKAVQPSSVMGATKRVAEMLVQNRAAQSCTTKFACVRFANVVGSRGSVIPIFLKQIADGKAITITDQRMSRYFMTIKEAVRLVLQASSLASKGEIYALDMGEPLRITDLARKLTQMSGLPANSVPMETIGIRPGEKLQEQLWYDGAHVTPTRFPRVYSVEGGEIPAEFETSVRELEQIALNRHNDEVLEKLRALPIHYKQESQMFRGMPSAKPS